MRHLGPLQSSRCSWKDNNAVKTRQTIRKGRKQINRRICVMREICDKYVWNEPRRRATRARTKLTKKNSYVIFLRELRVCRQAFVVYASRNPCFDNGSWRTRVPVAAKIALLTAGSTGGSAGSPNPVGGLFVVRKCTSISGGAWRMRTGW